MINGARKPLSRFVAPFAFVAPAGVVHRFAEVITMQPDRSAELSALLAQRLLVLDGAMGTMIQRHGLGEADYRGKRFADHPHDLKGNNDLLVLTRPDVIGGIHRDYLEAGADILETCTFNSTAVSQADYNLSELAYELNFEGARLARLLCDEFTAANPAKPRFVAGVVGPTSRTASISPDVNDPGYRNVDFDELVNNYIEAVTGLVEGGADLILVETVFDTLNAKAALFAIEQFFERAGRRWPVGFGFGTGPAGVLGAVDVALGMGHQAEDAARRVAWAGHILASRRGS